MRLPALLGGLLLLTSAPLAAAPGPEPSPPGREAVGPGSPRFAQANLDGDRLAGFEARLQRLEEEIRRLTGRLEELEYRQRRLEAAGETPPPGGPAPVATAPDAGAAPERLSAAGAGTEAPAESAAGAKRPPPATPIEADEAARRGYPPGETVPGDAVEAGRAPRGADEGPGRTPAGASPEERYEAALALLETGDFDAAEKAFSRFLEDFPDHPKAANAAFWLGETYFFRQDYATAASVYARNYRAYGPEAPRAPDTLLKLGMALAAIGDRERACQTFAELERRYPRAPAPVRQALERERAAIACG